LIKTVCIIVVRGKERDKKEKEIKEMKRLNDGEFVR
jgi:hypothetical protein